MLPTKLQPGDEIRILTPARSLQLPWIQAVKKQAEQQLTSMGFHVTYGKHVNEIDSFSSSSVQSRVEDMHEAFADKQVKAILTVIGGFNSNQLLSHLDYDLLQANPKILCGYSDITALQNAIHAKTGLVTYSGPHFFTFGMQKGLEYIEDHFKKCLMAAAPFEVQPSGQWSNDRWAQDQEHRTFFKNEGYEVLQEGTAQGTIIGGNLCTFNLLQGTPYMPSLKNTILFLEDDHESQPHHVDRNLQSILHQIDFSGVRGLVIGRFQPESGIDQETLIKIIASKDELRGIPIIANADFGHTYPMITFPIGGTATITASNHQATIRIEEH